VYPRARRNADIVASVPDDTSRTNSIDGSRRTSVSAITISLSVGAPERESVDRGFLHCANHGRMRVTQYRGTPGTDVIDVPLAIGVPYIRPFAPGEKARRTADRPKTREPEN